MTEFNTGIFNSSDLYAAREAFVKTANNIFAREAFVIERASSVDMLTGTTPVEQYLVWKRSVDGKYVELIPPPTTYENHVHSFDERDELLFDNSFAASVVNGDNPTVLVDMISNEDAPQWSVWEATLDNLPEDTNDSDATLTPDQADIFTSWGRASGGYYFANASAIPTGNSAAATTSLEYAAYEANSWSFANSTLNSTINSVNFVAFISPSVLTNYKHTVTVGSTNADDDEISIVIASTIVNGVPQSLVASRTQGGYTVNSAPYTWGIALWVGQSRTVLVNGSSYVHAASAPNDGTGGWAHFGDAKIEIVRRGNTVSCRTSQGNSTALDDATLITYEIPANSPFAGSSHYGYGAQSQPSAYFKDIELIGFGLSFVVNNPNLVFQPVKTYDISVSTLAERDLIPTPALNYKVMVEANADTNNFWTIWNWNGSDYDLVDYQNYRTVDFWDYADWYADGYSYLTPPAISYATTGERDVASATNREQFVKVLDGGDGNWIWCDYISGAWNVVAREKGTIALSEKFYDSTLTPLEDNVDSFANRDGVVELKFIIDALRQGVFTTAEQNELFYSMLHHIHASQDQVSWAFKTSFLNLTGYNEPLKAVPVQPIDNTQNLIDYITEVKPYRVKVREFSRVLSPEIDNAVVSASDFDFPPYLDPATNQYRILDLNNVRDRAVISSTQPWKAWYDNYTKTGRDLDEYTNTTWNPTRFMKIGLLFDRVDHLPIVFEERYANADSIIDTGINLTGRHVDVFIADVQTKAFSISGNSVVMSGGYTPMSANVSVIVRQSVTSGSAADRVTRFYAGIEETDIAKLTGINNDIIDGGIFGGAVDYNLQDGGGVDTINSGDGFQRSKNNPEELVAPSVTDTIMLTVKVDAAGGMPHQGYSTGIEGDEGAISHVLFYFDNADTVIPYADGKRVPETNYTVDFDEQTVTVTGMTASTFIVRTFDSHGSVSNVTIQPMSYAISGNYHLNSAIQTAETLFVDVNGLRLFPNDDYSVSGSNLHISKPIDANSTIYTMFFSNTAIMEMNTVAVTDINDAQLSTNGSKYTWMTVDGYYVDPFNPDLPPAPPSTPESYTFTANTVTSYEAKPTLADYIPVHMSVDGRTAVWYLENGDATELRLQNTATAAIIYTYNGTAIANSLPANFNANASNPYYNVTGICGIPDRDQILMLGTCIPVSRGSTCHWYAMYDINANSTITLHSSIIYDYNTISYAPSLLAANYDANGNVWVATETGYGTSHLRLLMLPNTNTWTGQLHTPTFNRLISNTINFFYDAHTQVSLGSDSGRGVILPVANGNTTVMRYYYFVSKHRLNYVTAQTGINAGYVCENFVQTAPSYPNGWMGYIDMTSNGSLTVDTSFNSVFPIANTDICLDGSINSTNNQSFNVGYTEYFATTKMNDGTYRMVIRKALSGAHNSNVGLAVQAVLIDLDPTTKTFEYFTEIHGPTVNTVAQFGAASYDPYTLLRHGSRILYGPDKSLLELYLVDKNTNEYMADTWIGYYTPPYTPEYSPRILVTTFDGAILNNDSWRKTLTRPAYDLFLPKETGDYDAGGVETYAYDVGVVPDTDGTTPILVAKHDSFRILDTTVSVGSLISPLNFDDDVIRISAVADITPPKIIDVQDANTTSTLQEARGAVWIEGERIEFETITANGAVTELSGLTRGTHNTSAGRENLQSARFTGDGSTHTFTLGGATSLNNMLVCVHEALTYPNGAIIANDGYTGFPVLVPKTFNVDYTAAITPSGVTITFTRAPNAGTTVYLTRHNDSNQYPAGISVYDGLTFKVDQNLV